MSSFPGRLALPPPDGVCVRIGRPSLYLVLVLVGCQIDPARTVPREQVAETERSVAPRTDPRQLRFKLMNERKAGRLDFFQCYRLALEAAAADEDPEIDRVLVEYYADRGVDLWRGLEAVAVGLYPKKQRPRVVRIGTWERGPAVDLTRPEYASNHIRFVQRGGLTIPVDDIVTGIH